MEPLKEMFNPAYYTHLAGSIKKNYPLFERDLFINEATHNLKILSLNQRLRNTSVVLKKYLPDNYNAALEILKEVITQQQRGYTTLVFPDYVSLYGLDFFEASMKALKFFTIFGSSEFAIRVFLKKDFKKTINLMEQWANDTNVHVRRLASEGSRPRLPWSFKLEEVIKNPHSTQKILDTLKSDSELYVKKSVANHLNDISKDNPDYMINVVKHWDKKNIHTAWIVKHASRTLIKKGNAKTLDVFDFEKKPLVVIEKFKIQKAKIKLGEKLQFDFKIKSLKNKSQKLVVDYIIHYKKKSDRNSQKVFKLKEINLQSKQTVAINKSQLFKNFTTRKHHSGKHLIEIMINGTVVAKKEFSLIVPER